MSADTLAIVKLAIFVIRVARGVMPERRNVRANVAFASHTTSRVCDCGAADHRQPTVLAGMKISIALLFFVGLGASVAPAAVAQNLEFRIANAMPYLQFDKLEHTRIDMPHGELIVGVAPGDIKIGKQRLFDWIRRSGVAISTFYGHFPVKSARVLIVPTDGNEISGGQAFSNAGAAIRLSAGADITARALDEDWQLPHEMVHLALPNLQESKWLSEGLAVYVESIARAQARDLTEEQIWGEFVKMMPTGLPKAGDKGLDESNDRDRIYWGGAIFWLMADLEIRNRTQNQFGLQDALLGIQAAGGDFEQVWTVERTLAVADKATGQSVLTEFYGTWRKTPISPDLIEVWKSLGVKMSGGQSVRFDDDAPLSNVRLAITRRRADASGSGDQPRKAPQ